jgi:hypothetical protein
MTSTVDNATVASLKKAIIQFKRQRLNQSKMKKKDLQDAVRALQIKCCPGAPAKKTRNRRPKMVKAVAASSKRSMKERRQLAKLRAAKKKTGTGKKKLFNSKKNLLGPTTTKVDEDIDFTY